jgi:serine/threonine-protein kinase
MSVLNTAHAMGVVHRDLKPENIMIGKSQTNSETSIKLLDLGIAKMREIAGVESAGTTELTMAGQVLGTPYYMSPEQWGELSRDGNPEIDGRTDIYSLGLVAYQMISGSRAYAAATLHELRRDHLSVMPPPLAEKVPGVPQEFSKVISRAISKDRSDRQSTAGELAAQLREGLGDSNGQLSSAERVATPAGPSRYAQTQGTPGAVATNSDVNAATIVTSDAIPTSPPNIPQLIPAAARQPEKSAAVAAVDDLQSVVTVMRPAAPTVEPKKSRGKTLALAGGGVLLLAVIVLGVGGVFALKWFKTKPAGDAINAGTTKTSKANDVLPEKPAGTPSEFGRYWLEVLPKEMVTEPKRVAGNAPL